MLPQEPAVALVEGESVRDLVGNAPVVGDHGVHKDGIPRDVRARLEASRPSPEVDLSLVKGVSKGPGRARVGVLHEELGQRGAVENRAKSSRVLVRDRVEHQPLARVHPEPKLPLLPSDQGARDREARAVRLDDLEGLRRLSLGREGRLVKLPRRGLQRDHARVEEANDPLRRQIDDGDHPFDRPGIRVVRRGLVVGHRLDDPPGPLLR